MILLQRIIPKIYSQELRYISKVSIKGREPVKRNAQIEYVQGILQRHIKDWKKVREAVLKKRGEINQKNFNGVLLKMLVKQRKLDMVPSFLNHIRLEEKVLSLGTVNGLLQYYYVLADERDLSYKEKSLVLSSYKDLYDKYKLLDATTCERLLHVLCAINEHDKAMKVLEDIKQSAKPSHSAYGTLVASLFKNNKKVEAFKVIEDCTNNQRQLSDKAYNEWVQYILRTYKSKTTVIKHLDEMNTQIKNSFTMISSKTGELLKKIYTSLGWTAEFSHIRKQDGRCSCCKNKLQLLSLTQDEFKILQSNVKDKLIIGSDLFVKTSPEELKRFLEFVEQTKPYDIVLDALNISYAAQGGAAVNKLEVLNIVVDKFTSQKKKVLLLGRKHMLSWRRNELRNILNKTCSFFTDDLSQDDPFFITAAILSGAHTDIVSKDLLRGHVFNMKDEYLRQLFKRWQWQHQWMVFWNWKTGVQTQPPLSFTPCAQQTQDCCWHLPYDQEDLDTHGRVKDGYPNLFSWLCLSKKVNR